jgi:hypothetical protein
MLAALIGMVAAMVLNAASRPYVNVAVPWLVYQLSLEFLFYYVARHMYNVRLALVRPHIFSVDNVPIAWSCRERAPGVWCWRTLCARWRYATTAHLCTHTFPGRLAEMTCRIFDDTLTMVLSLLIVDAAYNKLAG